MNGEIAVLEVGWDGCWVGVDCGRVGQAEWNGAGVEPLEFVEAVVAIADGGRCEDCRR